MGKSGAQLWQGRAEDAAPGRHQSKVALQTLEDVYSIERATRSRRSCMLRSDRDRVADMSLA